MAIWYRHWLETRIAAVVLLLAAAFIIYRFDRELGELVARFETTGRLPATGARWFQPLIASRSPQEVIPLIAHADSMVVLFWVSALVLCGSGFGVVSLGSRSTSWSVPAAAVQYTLSLPVSRTTLVITRVMAGALLALAAFALGCGGNAVVTAWRGLPVAAAGFTAVGATAFVAAVFWMATLGLLIQVVGAGLAIVGAIIGMMVSIALIGPGMAAAAAHAGTLLAIALMAALSTAGVVWLSIETVKGEEV